MNKKILLSPVGGSDPMPESNDHDGAMIHICRVYKVDKVYMYMSKEILEKHALDNRYVYCLNKLSELIGKNIGYEIIKRENLIDVWNFDYFYDEFNDVLKTLENKLDSTDELLINVTSGTAAMMSSLVVLSAMCSIRCRCIQVTTPDKKMNTHIHSDDYILEERWGCNHDNDNGFVNRCIELKSRPLINIANEKIIKEHIKSYDYQAAKTVTDSMPEYETKEYTHLINLAYERYLTNTYGIDKLIKENNIDKSRIFPQRSDEWRTIFEYTLTLDIRIKRHEYGDFVRATSPVIFELFNGILKKYEKFNLDDYTYIDKKKIRRWDKERLKPEYAKYLENANRGQFDYKGYVKSVHLKDIIINCQSVSKIRGLTKLVQELREIEDNIRNLAAHTMICVTDEIVTKRTGYNCEQIMDKIKKAFEYTTANIKADDWNSYDIMNNEIIRKMNY